MTDFITKLRKHKIKISDTTELAVFDITASYVGIYMLSKYTFEVEKPAMTALISLIPVSYVVHQFFDVETPLNDLINGKQKDHPQQPAVPTDNNLQQSQQEQRSRTEQPDLQSNILQITPYEKMDVKPSPIRDGLNKVFNLRP